MREESGEGIDQKNPDMMTIPCCSLAESYLISERIQHGGSMKTGRNRISQVLAPYGINYYFFARKTEAILNRPVDIVEDGTLLPFAEESANRDKKLIYDGRDI